MLGGGADVLGSARALFGAAAERLGGETAAAAQELGTLLWASAKLGLRHVGLQAAVARRLLRAEAVAGGGNALLAAASAQDLAHLAWGLAKLHAAPADDQTGGGGGGGVGGACACGPLPRPSRRRQLAAVGDFVPTDRDRT